MSAEFFKAIDFLRSKWVDYLKCPRQHCKGGIIFIKLSLEMDRTQKNLRSNAINVVIAKILIEDILRSVHTNWIKTKKSFIRLRFKLEVIFDASLWNEDVDGKLYRELSKRR